jgi:hypothetical protein
MSPQSWLQQPQQPKPPGKLWWIATAVCHVLNAFVFAAGVGACIHWIARVNTHAYYEAHRHADPDGMILLQFVVLGLAAVVALGVVYAFLGLGLTLGKYQSGPAMLLGAVPVVGLGGLIALGELLDSAASWSDLVLLALIVTVIVSVLASWMALTTPQSPKKQAGVMPPHPAPYTGGSPYLR